MIRTHQWRKNSERGFTLVEMLVAVALFAIVMTVSVGSLLTLVDANKKAQALKSVMNNLNFALENMSRNIRVGTTYHCNTSATVPANIDTPNDCPSGGVLIGFEPTGGDPNDKSDQIVYRLNGNRLERSTDGGATFLSVTAEEVRITNLDFFVTGAEISGDTEQPRVVMVIQGVAGPTPALESEFNIQATVSQRLLDI